MLPRANVGGWMRWSQLYASGHAAGAEDIDRSDGREMCAATIRIGYLIGLGAPLISLSTLQ
jgi:hypothetical protein